jgi:hypothetical protein
MLLSSPTPPRPTVPRGFPLRHTSRRTWAWTCQGRFIPVHGCSYLLPLLTPQYPEASHFATPPGTHGPGLVKVASFLFMDLSCCSHLLPLLAPQYPEASHFATPPGAHGPGLVKVASFLSMDLSCCSHLLPLLAPWYLEASHFATPPSTHGPGLVRVASAETSPIEASVIPHGLRTISMRNHHHTCITPSAIPLKATHGQLVCAMTRYVQ